MVDNDVNILLLKIKQKEVSVKNKSLSELAYTIAYENRIYLTLQQFDLNLYLAIEIVYT